MTVSVIVEGGEKWGASISDVDLAKKEARIVARTKRRTVQVIEDSSGRVLFSARHMGISDDGERNAGMLRLLQACERDAPSGFAPCPSVTVHVAKRLEVAAGYYGVSVDAVLRAAIELGLSRLGTDS